MINRRKSPPQDLLTTVFIYSSEESRKIICTMSFTTRADEGQEDLIRSSLTLIALLTIAAFRVGELSEAVAKEESALKSEMDGVKLKLEAVSKRSKAAASLRSITYLADDALADDLAGVPPSALLPIHASVDEAARQLLPTKALPISIRSSWPHGVHIYFRVGEKALTVANGEVVEARFPDDDISELVLRKFLEGKLTSHRSIGGDVTLAPMGKGAMAVVSGVSDVDGAVEFCEHAGKNELGARSGRRRKGARRAKLCI